MLNKINFNPQKIVENILFVLTVCGVGYSLYYTFSNFDSPQIVNIVIALPFLFFLTPYLVLKLYSIKVVDSKMSVIPRFLRDVVDSVESGTDLVSSIKDSVGNEYGVLNEDILKLSNQLSWGVDFEVAFINFAKNVGSADLKRDFLLVIEARRVGGHVETILREISLKITVEILRKTERKSNLSSNTFTGYISFIIFVFIIVLVYNNLFLGLGSALLNQGGAVPIDGSVPGDNPITNIYLTLLILLSYELAILSGFLFGLMQENDIIAGAPHVVALTLITFVGFFFFIAY
jgi:pilus assembly protein TadC